MTEDKTSIWKRLLDWLKNRLVSKLKKERTVIFEAFDDFTDKQYEDAKNALYAEYDVPDEAKKYIDKYIEVANDMTDKQFEKFFDILVEYLSR